jgi:hypothetical protein
MRLRAVALEAGTESDDEDLEQASALLRELEPDAAP